MIPREVHESAAIDGASGWQEFRAVTGPMLLLFLLLQRFLLRGLLLGRVEN